MKNDKYLKPIRKQLRQTQTKEESILWQLLRARKFKGYKFYRQYSIDRYIADFYCPKLKLVIELDGNHHYTKEGLLYDKIREEYMNSLGIKTLRFRNKEIRIDIDKVLEIIKKYI